MEDTGPVAFNPATNVNLSFSTFDLENTERAPDNLKYTRFRDFYQGIQPSGTDDNANNRETANEIRGHIDRFIQATRAENGNSYEKVRNPLDLINQIIASNQVPNFRDGRTYINQRIAAEQSGTYNTRANEALIRFTDQDDKLNDAPLNKKLWIFPTLSWSYVPADDSKSNHLEDKVFRTVQYVSRKVVSEASEAQPELLSVLAGSRFSANGFSTSGYNSPEYATADYISRNYGGIELRQEFSGEKIDTLFIKSAEKAVLDLSRHGVTVTNSSPDCLRVELDYVTSTLRVFYSDGEPATSENPAYCGTHENSDAAVSWAAAGAFERQ